MHHITWCGTLFSVLHIFIWHLIPELIMFNHVINFTECLSSHLISQQHTSSDSAPASVCTQMLMWTLQYHFNGTQVERMSWSAEGARDVSWWRHSRYRNFCLDVSILAVSHSKLQVRLVLCTGSPTAYCARSYGHEVCKCNFFPSFCGFTAAYTESKHELPTFTTAGGNDSTTTTMMMMIRTQQWVVSLAEF